MIAPQHFPFVISLLPFLAVGICLPPTLHDCIRGGLMRGDVTTLAVGLVITVAWYWAILHSVKSKKREGKQTLLGRALESWLWAPPIAFVVGLACGVGLLFA